MAFELVGPTRTATIVFEHELLLDMAELSGTGGPQITRLRAEFYDSPRWSAEGAELLRREFASLLAAFRADPQLAQRAWDATPPAYRRDYPRPVDAELAAKCSEIIAVCEDGMRSGAGLHSLSD